MIERRTARARAAALPERGGLAAAALAAAALPYAAVVRMRNALYDRGLLRARGADVPSICVGNLSTGGTGKTPLVARLASAARAAGRRPAILTRGYVPAGAASTVSAEVRLYGRLVPDVPVVVDGDRVRGAARATADGADLLLLDDGFQHRRFRRDVDLVLLDARDPMGGGMLPAGRLREPPSGLRRAAAVVLTRCGRATDDQLRAAAAAVEAAAPGTPLLLEDHVPVGFVDVDGAPVETSLEGVPALVFSGIADGGALAETVEALGARPVRVVDFGDHHAFTAPEIARLADEAAALGAAVAVTTEKDLVRLDGDAAWPGGVPLVAPRIAAGFPPNDRAALGGIVGFEIPAEVGE